MACQSAGPLKMTEEWSFLQASIRLLFSHHKITCRHSGWFNRGNTEVRFLEAVRLFLGLDHLPEDWGCCSAWERWTFGDENCVGGIQKTQNASLRRLTSLIWELEMLSASYVHQTCLETKWAKLLESKPQESPEKFWDLQPGCSEMAFGHQPL